MKRRWLSAVGLMVGLSVACSEKERASPEAPAVEAKRPMEVKPARGGGAMETRAKSPPAVPPAEPAAAIAPAWGIADGELKGLRTSIVDVEHQGMAPLYRALTAVKRGGAIARVAYFGTSLIAAGGPTGVTRLHLYAPDLAHLAPRGERVLGTQLYQAILFGLRDWQAAGAVSRR